MDDASLLRHFNDYGRSASFHLAAEGSNEWRHAYSFQRRCYEMYDSQPHLQERFREIAEGFLWGQEFLRRVTADTAYKEPGND